MLKKFFVILIVLNILVLSSCSNSAQPEPTKGVVSTTSAVVASNPVSTASVSHGVNSALPTDALSRKQNAFELKDINSNTVKSASYTGKPTIINFFASWCDYCMQEMPYFTKLEKEYGSKINMVYINSSDILDTDDIKSLFRQNNWIYTNLLIDKDAKTLHSYGFTGIPVTLIIDSTGTIRKIKSGAFSSYQQLKNYVVQYGQVN